MSNPIEEEHTEHVQSVGNNDDHRQIEKKEKVMVSKKKAKIDSFGRTNNLMSHYGKKTSTRSLVGNLQTSWRSFKNSIPIEKRLIKLGKYLLIQRSQ